MDGWQKMPTLIFYHEWTRSVNPIQNLIEIAKPLIIQRKFAPTRQNFSLLPGTCADTFTDSLADIFARDIPMMALKSRMKWA
jgi:hypothetical protein